MSRLGGRSLAAKIDRKPEPDCDAGPEIGAIAKAPEVLLAV